MPKMAKVEILVLLPCYQRVRDESMGICFILSFGKYTFQLAMCKASKSRRRVPEKEAFSVAKTT